MSRNEKIVAKLVEKGFDLSFVDEYGVDLVCSQCVAVAICGYPCHETGCPNKVSR